MQRLVSDGTIAPLPGHYDIRLVVLSVLIAMLASFAALDFAGRVTSSAGPSRLRWLAVGAMVMGIGIWSMHFIGMLAFSLPVPIGYGLPLMLLSVAVAIAASLLALTVVSRPELSRSTLLSAGLLMGAAIAGMHYIGMASLQVPARMTHTRSAVLLSLVIAFLASVAALWLAFRFRSDMSRRGLLLKILSAIVMGIAISGMHYTAMSGARFTQDGMMHFGTSDYVLATGQLVWAVVAGALSLMLLSLIESAFDRRMLRAQLAFREEADLTVRANEEYFRILSQNSPEIIVVLNADGTIRHGAGKSPLSRDYSPDPNVQSVFDSVHPDDLDDARGMLAKTLSHPSETQTLALRARRNKDSAWRTFDVQATNLLGSPPVDGIVVNCRDVTRRVELEEKIRQGSKMEGLGRLAGGVAHDFNNLLTVIQGNAELLLGGNADGQAGESLLEIQRAAERGSSLTRQLLAFSRQQLVQPCAVNLNHTIASITGILTRMIGEDVEIYTKLDPSLGAIMIDPTQLEQVILNLAVNARDALPTGGILRLETQNVDLLSDAGAQSFVQLEVSDNGPGISPDVLPHVFEPFFTTKKLGEGTGLGLATVYGVVENAGGQISVENLPKGGTSFRIKFPRSHAAVAPERVKMPLHRDSQSGQTILLVEDQPDVRRVIEKILRLSGYKVLEADGGERALQLIEDHPGPIDLLLTDVVMPRMKGPELARVGRPLRPEMKIAFISGYIEDNDMRQELLDTGAVFIEKPFEPATLAAKVAQALT